MSKESVELEVGPLERLREACLQEYVILDMLDFQPAADWPARIKRLHALARDVVSHLGKRDGCPMEPRPESIHDACDARNAVSALLEWVESVRTKERASGSSTVAAPAKSEEPAAPTEELTATEQALLIYSRDVNQSLRSVAKKVGCDVSLLSRNKAFKRLREEGTGDIPKGSKTKEGKLEAKDKGLSPVDEAAIREFVEQADPETRKWFESLTVEKQLEVVNDPDKHP